MNEKKHILVVDDDKRIRKLIQKYLRKNNYLVSTASNASEALSYTALIDFDLFILDVMMPGEDGLSLTKKLLNKYLTPIILLTARKETSDRIIGLETGADDYISKPFEPRELILRIESILKRIKKFGEKKSNKDISIGILKFDSKRQELWNGDYLIPLTRAERLLINKLINSVNEPVPRRQLAKEIFNDFNKKVKVDLINSDTYKDLERERVVDVNINRLRKKIEKNPKSPRYLKTVRSIGYMLVPD
jgi:two-component system phosphate regulon response regulator OmpR